jgi:hypothetical protein
MRCGAALKVFQEEPAMMIPNQIGRHFLAGRNGAGFDIGQTLEIKEEMAINSPGVNNADVVYCISVCVFNYSLLVRRRV